MDTSGNPLVTIGIPTYNRSNSYLRYSLESALNQTYKNLEIVVSDNCSPDKTKEFVLSYNDERIKYYRHDIPVKPHENANFCVMNAHGEYFLLLHDDDVIDDDFVEVAVGAIDGRDVGMVRTGARTIDSEGNVIDIRKNPHNRSTTFEFFQAVLFGRAVTYLCNTLYTTKYLREIDGFHSKNYTYSDVVTNIKIAHRYGRIEVEDVKASYRKHISKQGSSMNISKWCEDSLQVIDVMSELMPEHKEYFQHEGKKYFSIINYSRVQRIVKPLMRPYAYYIVYKINGFRYSPLHYYFHKRGRIFSRLWSLILNINPRH
jgi:glycosyltransferase involved in cell wall biosynthesis